jgi:hypothetical protein
LLHDLSIRDPLTNVKRKVLLAFRNGVTYNESVAKKRLPQEVLQYFAKMGQKGGLIGGRVRAQRLTPEQRTESARKAVLARWARNKQK